MTAHHRDGVAGRLGFAALWGLERACLRRATAIQVLSDYSSELLWKLYRISREKVVKIPGAVDTASFRPAEDRAAVRKALDLPAERSLLLTVRNLEGRMGLDLLIRTMAILTQNMPEALLLIGGGGGPPPGGRAVWKAPRLPRGGGLPPVVSGRGVAPFHPRAGGL